MTPPELELAFLLARTREGREAATPRIRQLAATVDYDTLAGELVRRRLLPLLGARLAELAPQDVPEQFRQAVTHALGQGRARGLVLQLQVEETVRALEQEGITALPLKGPALAEAAHNDIGLRVSGDIDLLVGARDLHRAVAVLRGRGFQAPHDAVDADGLPDLHFALPHPTLAPVELHWRIHWYDHRFSADLVERQTPADTAATLLLIYARDGFLGLRLAADLAGWWDRHGDEVPPGALAGHLETYPELARTWLAAATMAERVAAVPALGWFGVGAPLDRRSRLALRLGNWCESGEYNQQIANVTLVDALLAPKGMRGAVVQRSIGRAPGNRAVHAAKMSARSALGLARVCAGPWAPLPA
jgi:hypothetical protein